MLNKQLHGYNIKGIKVKVVSLLKAQWKKITYISKTESQVPHHVSQTTPNERIKILQEGSFELPFHFGTERTHATSNDHSHVNEVSNHALLFLCSEGLLLECPLSMYRERNKQVSGNHILFFTVK